MIARWHWRFLAAASPLIIAGAFAAYGRLTGPIDEHHVYMGVAYEIGSIDHIEGFYWRLTPAPGTHRYLGEPGTGEYLPTLSAADAAAQTYILQQKLYPTGGVR